MKFFIQNVYHQIKNLFQTNLGRQIFYYGLFYVFVWIFHLMIVSVISYFHLILGHNIGTIADWIVDRGWAVIIFTKLVIFYFAILFMRIRVKKYNLVRGMLQNAVSWPRHETAVVIVFLLLGLITAGDVRFNEAYIFDLTRPIIATIGAAVFFGVDLFLILILDVFHPLKKEVELKKKWFIFGFLFYFFTRLTFIYEQNISLKLFSYMFLLMYLAYWRRRNWTLPLVCLVGFIIPSIVLFGLDPIWGFAFTLFKANRNVGSVIHFILIFFSIAYLEWRKIKHPEYIYRD